MKKISIIIPTFNRANLLGETLDSILAQSCENWECLIVDDGSTDETDNLLVIYLKKEERFKYFKRPGNKLKGANACRNIGLENATGDYVIFFDSDDLMTNDHLEIKLNAIEKHNCDYIITRTKYFNKDNSQIDTYYQFDKYEITPFNYIAQNINWLTYDILLKTSLATQIRFNEYLQSGQEYNYFSKLVLLSTKSVFVDETVTLRRYHEQSIRSQLKSEMEFNKSVFTTSWLTYLDTKDVADENIQKVLLYRCSAIVIKWNTVFDANFVAFFYQLYCVYGFPAFYLLLQFYAKWMFNKGYYFRTKFLRGIERKFD